MSQSTDLAELPPSSIPPEQRGNLIIAKRVHDQIARRAALSVPGVVVRKAGLKNMSLTSLPRINYKASGSDMRFTIDVAAEWPTDLRVLCDRVCREVTDAAQRLTGMNVQGVDINIKEFATSEKTTAKVARRVE